MLVQTLITDYFPVHMENKMKQMTNENKVQTLITDYYGKKRKLSYDNNYLEESNRKNKKDKVYGYNPETDSWHCLECGVDMGPQNPRQLCGKYYCYYGE